MIISSKCSTRTDCFAPRFACDDPVLFLEHKHLYRQAYNKSAYPPDDFMIPFGKAKKVREGKDLTIITYGALVQRSLVAAKQAEQEGTSVEIIDLRSLVPYDWNAIAESVATKPRYRRARRFIRLDTALRSLRAFRTSSFSTSMPQFAAFARSIHSSLMHPNSRMQYFRNLPMC